MTDPIKVLRAARPTPENSWATSEAGVDVMLRAIALGESDDTITRVEPPNRRRRRRFWGGAVAVVVIGGSAAAGYFHLNQPRAADEGGCYQTFKADGDVTIAVPPNRAVAKLGIVQACLNEVPPDWGYQDANLVICVAASGGVGVFPAPKGETDSTACPMLGDWTPMPDPAPPTQ